MQKLLAATVVLGAGLAFAQVKETADIAVNGSVDVFSAYVWRGQVLNNGLVAQPSLTLEKMGFSLELWSNYNIDGTNGREDTDFTEIDFKLAYQIPVTTDDFSLQVGLIHYTFPESKGQEGWKDTTELFVSAVFPSIILNPTIDIYYDCDQGKGWYGSFGLSHTFELSDALDFTLGGSIGYAESGFAQASYGDTANSGWNDYNVYASASYALTDKLSLGAKIAYTVLDDSYADRDEYDAAGDLIWGGVSLSYQF